MVCLSHIAGLAIVLRVLCSTSPRVIPVVKQPENKSLEFVQLIGTLYYQKHENHDLLQKKYGYFAELVRRQLLIDIDDEDMKRENIQQLAFRTGMAEADVRMILDRVSRYLQPSSSLTDKQLQASIDGLDRIISNL